MTVKPFDANLQEGELPGTHLIPVEEGDEPELCLARADGKGRSSIDRDRFTLETGVHS